MREKWGVTYQLIPPDIQRRNAVERAICTYKAHFLAILVRVAGDFSYHLWGLLLPQSELTHNLLQQSSVNLDILAWEHYNGAFNCDVTPLVTLGTCVIAYNTPGKWLSWTFC